MLFPEVSVGHEGEARSEYPHFMHIPASEEPITKVVEA
jgi:hypothetical protein